MQYAIDQYHQLLLDTWAQVHATKNSSAAPIPGFDRAPYLGHQLVQGRAVLFLGMNPSYVEGTLDDHWTAALAGDETMAGIKVRDALQWPPVASALSGTDWKQAILTLDRYSRENHERFYGLIEDLATDAGAKDDWQQLDMFPIRHTAQRQLEAFLDDLRNPPTRTETDAPGHQVFSLLFDAAWELVTALRPKVVVVLNARLSRLLEQRLPLTLQANGHRHETDRMPSVPFLLASQLSGGATSIYGRKRLAADLRDALRGGPGLAP